MAKSESLYVSQSFQNSQVTIVPADTTSLKTLFTAGADGAIITGIHVSSTDTAAIDIQLIQTVKDQAGANPTDILLQTFTIPIQAGNIAGTAPINLLDTLKTYDLNNAGKTVLNLGSGGVLKVKTATATITANKVINFVCFGKSMTA